MCARVLFVLPVLLLYGCSDPTLTITGKLTRAGEALAVREGTYLRIAFIPETAGPLKLSSPTFVASYNHKTDSFSVSLPPGKYKAHVSMSMGESIGGMPALPKAQLLAEIYDFGANTDIRVELNP